MLYVYKNNNIGLREKKIDLITFRYNVKYHTCEYYFIILKSLIIDNNPVAWNMK